MQDHHFPVTNIIDRRGYEGTIKNAYVAGDESQDPLIVYQSGVKTKNKAGHISGPAMYDHYIIHFLTKGCGTFSCGNHVYAISAGDAFLIKPYELVTYQASHDDPYHYLWVGFHGTEATSLIKLSGFSSERVVVHYQNAERITGIMTEISSISEGGPAERYLLTGLLYQLFSVFMQDSPFQTRKDDHNYELEAIRYIRNNLSNPNLSVSNVASKIGINRSHLFRLFKNYCDISVEGFIIRLRFDRAKELLLQTDYAIADIALGCGFSNPTHFTQLFKKHIGMTPVDYRKMNQRK